MAQSKKNLHTDFNSLRNFVMDKNSPDPNRKLMVSDKEQQDEINLLQQTTGDERFFFIVNMDDFAIEYAYGIRKWLGYNDADFSLKKYWDAVVFPESKKSLILISQQMYKLLLGGHFQLEFMTQRFAGHIILKNVKGEYKLAKKTSAIFQYDDNNRLVKYIDEFTILGDYSENSVLENAFGTRIFNTGGASESEKIEHILKEMLDQFYRMKIFTPRELQIARTIAYNYKITKKEIATIFKISPATIVTFNNRFLQKARDFFNIDFPDTLTAALYLKKEGLL